MKEATTFSAELMNLEAFRFPFVEIIYKVAEGYRKGYLMIDTASNDNMLSSGIVQYLDPASATGNRRLMSGIQNASAECAEYNCEFMIGNVKFESTFYVHPNNHDEIFGDGHIMGLVGNRFMKDYGLVLDYQTRTFRQNIEHKKVNKEDCSFYFPLSFGFSRYNMPAVVGVSADEKRFILYADSGCDVNSITKHVLEQLSDNIVYTGNEFRKKSFEHTSDVKEVTGSFNLLSLTNDKGDMTTRRYDGVFHVNDKYDHLIMMDKYTDSKGQPLLPVSGLISSQFMTQNKWIIDFGIGVIYSIKENN